MNSADSAQSGRRGLAAKLETVVNVAVLVAALLTTAFFVDLFLSRRSDDRRPVLAPGMRLALPTSHDFSAHEKTLIIALQEGCSYCEESVPFYRQLSAALDGDCAEIGVVAAMPHPRAMAEALLERHGLSFSGLADTSLASLGVAGTPTLILVDRVGTVLDVWVGRLSQQREEEVLAAVRPLEACQ